MEELKNVEKNQNNKILDSEQQTWSAVSRWVAFKMELSDFWCTFGRLMFWYDTWKLQGHLSTKLLFSREPSWKVTDPKHRNTRDIVHDITCVVTWFSITGKGSQKQKSFCWIRPMAVKIVRHCIVTDSHWPKTMRLAQLWELDYVLAAAAMRKTKPKEPKEEMLCKRTMTEKTCSWTLKMDMNIRGEAHGDVH